MLVSSLHRDKGEGCAPCLRVTLHPLAMVLCQVPVSWSPCWSPGLVDFLPARKRLRGRADASNCLMKARMLPHLPLHLGLASICCSQEWRENIMGFEGI